MLNTEALSGQGPDSQTLIPDLDSNVQIQHDVENAVPAEVEQQDTQVIAFGSTRSGRSFRGNQSSVPPTFDPG